MATYSQEIIFTVVPNGLEKLSFEGIEHTYLKFSLVVSPRLKSVGDPAPTLAHYPDWAVGPNPNSRPWPDTISALFGSMRLHVIGLPGSPYGLVFPSDPTRPDDLRFPTVFPSTTDVIPYDYQGFEDRKIRSAPVHQAVDAIQELYGRFGLKSPTSFPAFKDIVDVTGFGPMGFQQTNRPSSVGEGEFGIPGSGQARKQSLTNAIETELAAHQAVDPANLLAMAQAKGLASQGGVKSLVFLQHLQFLQRGLPKVTNTFTTSPPAPEWDFHKMVAGLGSLPTLLRVLGYVVDFHAGPLTTDAVNAITGGLDNVQVTFSVNTGVNPDHPESSFLLPTNGIFPITISQLATGVFKARPQNAANSDHVARMLKIGNTNLFRVIRVDHDTAVLKAVQFANNVTRSRKGSKKQTMTTPDNYALPALRTGGFAIARTARAVQMVNTLKRQTDDLQGGGSTPFLYEDDLVRGYRFDVFDVDDRRWRSLMWRQGTVTVNGSDPLDVLEEDTVVPAPTEQSDPDNPNNDLYLQETLTRWDGWSMAVPRIGKSFLQTDSTRAKSGSEGFNVTTDWHVPGEISDGSDEGKPGNANRLPRLRFGRQYQFRARVADLAGNALPVKTAPGSGIVVSDRLHHLRFEPLPAPRAVLLKSGLRQDLDILRNGDSDEVVVIRSESATVDVKDADMDNGVSMRLLLPGRGSVSMAEQHGAFDQKSTFGQPMDRSVFTDISHRDATPIFDGADLLDGSTPPWPPSPPDIPDQTGNSTENPFLYPDSLSIKYLADFASPSAVIHDLPLNAFKESTVNLPFDLAKNGWPVRQAARVRLTRSPNSGNNWTVAEVPNKTASDREAQLNLMLGKGYEFTTLLNSGMSPDTVDLMAVWEWIFLYGQAHNLPSDNVRKQILASRHWMFTPWRKVRFVHAVRTPLLKPELLLIPTKTDIGQTYALFHGTQANPKPGTIIFSRRSTARVDVDATWAMQIDDGVTVNPAPNLAQDFQVHAFDIEPARQGFAYVPGAKESITTSVDGQNINLKHEFHDTKYRRVTYKGTATSYYVEFFRESKNLTLGADPVGTLKAGPVQPGVAFEGSTVRLILRDDNGFRRVLTPAPAGTDPAVAAPTPGDYIVVEDTHLNGANPNLATHGTIQMLANSPVTDNTLTNPFIEFSYVGPTIHTFSNPAADRTQNVIIPNSARPKAPDVLYVVPIYKRTAGRGSVTRVGGGLRVYLNRPWWSSGDEERLGVLCWHPKPTDGTLPPDALAPYVTRWGFDPIFKSTGVPKQPTPACFPLATSSRSDGGLTIDESSTNVDVAGHTVGWDEDRRLWYCDIQVTDASGKELTSYTPFIKLAVARYQPFSIPDTHLSRVVQVDYAQLAPNRHVSVSGSGGNRKVVVTGRSPRATADHTAVNKIVILIEQKDVRITDDAIAWDPATGRSPFKNRITMLPSTSGTGDFVTWNASITLPVGNTKPLRLAFEEYERIDGGFGGGRLAYTETIPL